MEGGNGGMLPVSTGSGMLGLEIALHHHHQHQDHLFPISAQSHDVDHQRPQQQQIRYAYNAYCSSRGKRQPAGSPEDDPGFGEEVVGAGGAADGSKLASPSPSLWQRMKWTDNMIRLLIMVVYCMGDDTGGAEADHHPQSAAAGKGKKAPPPQGALHQHQQQQQQKKGKWKSVSRAMMEKGFYVSPQQCEDKFNDLNKRYKRVNELLGKGTACRVVENQALLDSMDHLTPKAKDEARKLLNSKHLFFREMCAYHSAAAVGGGAVTSSCAPPPPQQPPASDHHQLQQICFHHPSGAAAMEDDHDYEDVNEELDDHEDDEDDDYCGDDGEEEEDDDNDDEDDDHNTSKKHHQHHRKHEEGDEDEGNKGFIAATTTSTTSGGKRPRGRASTQPKSSASPPLSLSLWSPPETSIKQLRCDLTGLSEQRQWLRRRAVELEEQRVGYQCRALQLERQRFKWLRFSSNKEREMDRVRLVNERLRLENERMLLHLRHKELDLVNGAGGGAASSPSSH